MKAETYREHLNELRLQIEELKAQLAKETNVPTNDTVSRQAAIDVARKCPVVEVTPAYMLIDKAEVMTDLMQLPYAKPEIIRCKDCRHRPKVDEDGELEFPTSFKCPCQCDDYWYSWMPKDDWFCGSAERRTDEHSNLDNSSL